jgi:cytochrome c556
MILFKKIIKITKIFIFTLIFSLNFSVSSYANQSVEEIIKGRKAMFSENYQNAKKISILLKSKKIEEAKPLIKKISDNYKKLLDYFPDNTKEGFKTEALPSIWENKDEFNALMQKASNDMTQLVKAIDTAEDLRAIQKKLMWSNCSSCHNKFRAEH